MKRASLFLACGLIASSVAHGQELARERVEGIVQAAAVELESLKTTRRDGSAFWNLPVDYGNHYVSQALLVREWIGQPFSATEKRRISSFLRGLQRSDGSWKAIADANQPKGDSTASIFNYWALKVIHQDGSQSRALSRARSWIARNGGLSGANQQVKVFLALFGNESWDFLPAIPKMFFGNLAIVNHKDFALWLKDAMLPIAYFKKLNYHRDLGEAFSLKEFLTPEAQAKLARDTRKSKESRRSVRSFVEKMVEGQQPAGNWGPSVVSSWLTVMALNEYGSSASGNAQLYGAQIQRSLKWTEYLLFKHGGVEFKGTTHDGHLWDTSWAMVALQESASVRGVSARENDDVARYLARKQHRGGGFICGDDFLEHPDTDDTALCILALSVFGDRYRGNIDKAVSWLGEMQNRDGGFPAFTQGVSSNFIANLFMRGFGKDYLYDRSSADVTGHVLEALGALGLNASNSRVVREGQQFLDESRERVPGTSAKLWQGRWGVNYLYGTSTAVSGLVRSGARLDAEAEEAISWLESKQNADGGFGESIQSYADASYAGRGKSTATQSSWALMALVDAGRGQGRAARRAAAYLAEAYENGGWKDPAIVGTGIPQLEYMNYPIYPKTFPLIALSRWLRAQ
jgi:squalene-hopene/tetraprenyl-beta-curcumene cyclase